MKIVTNNQALVDIITTGKSSDRRYRNLPTSVINSFLRAYNTMLNVDKVEDLYQHKGLHYERLKGKMSGYESIRCGIQYRLIFTSSTADDTLFVDKIELIEISNHYGDN